MPDAEAAVGLLAPGEEAGDRALRRALFELGATIPGHYSPHMASAIR